MAEISVYFPPEILKGQEIADAYVRMVEAFNAILFPKGGGLDWKIVCIGEGSWKIRADGIYLARRIYFDQKIIDHSYFEIDQKYQNKNLSSAAMKATLEIADLLGLKTAAVDANIDVGGYAWLRKGAFPLDGLFELQGIAENRSYRQPELAEKLLKRLKEVGDGKALRQFILSPEFQEYKPIFLGSLWSGTFDLTDPVVRTAMVQGAEAAFEKLMRGEAVLKVIPLTINEQIMNEYVKFQMRSLNFSSTLAKLSQELLNQTEEAVNALLLKYGQKFEGFTNYTTLEARKLFAQLKKDLLLARELGWVKVNKLVNDQLEQYAIQQAKAAAAVIEGPVPVVLGLNLPSVKTLYAIVTAQPFEGRVLGDWLARTAALDHERINKMAVQGIVNGMTPTNVARLVLGTKAMKGSDGYCRKAFKDLESVLLTATSGIQNQVRQALYEENADVFNEEYFVATLDVNTTYECAGHDGERYKIGQGPMPPLHFRCRSLRVPFIHEDILRKRGYKSSFEKQLVQEFAQKNGLPAYSKREQLPTGYKTKFDQYAQKRNREMVGQVPAKTTFTKWFKEQSPSFQDEYLGKARAEKYRKGLVDIKDFSSASGRTYTIEELFPAG